MCIRDKCTTVPCPVVGTNHLALAGGGTMTYIYASHNGKPIVTSATGSISKSDLDQGIIITMITITIIITIIIIGSDTTSCTQSYARSLDDDGVQDCDAGHIVAHRLGGPGNQPLNIFPQDLSENRGPYAQYEDSIYDCIASAGAVASLSWTFTYSSSTQTKPVKVQYNAKFSKGPCTTLTETFAN